jgi:hypothetical protein
MIAAQNQRNLAGLKRLQNKVGALAASGGDFLKVLGIGGAFFFLLRDSHRNVARIFDDVPDGFEAGFKARHPDRGRPHVHATARLPKVKRDADYTDLAGGDAAEGSIWVGHK